MFGRVKGFNFFKVWDENNKMNRTAQRAKEETPRQKKPQACILFSTALPFQQTDIIQK